MELQAIRQINIDVSNHKYIQIDAKQYDRNLRYILITCYHQGEFLPVNKNTCFASIRYRKPDSYGVFNACEITQDGKILVELTEQMLAVSGVCYADLVIHEKLNLSVNIVENADGTVEIIDTGDSGIISTMTFVVYVHEAAFDNHEVESSYEYNALNDLMTEARRSYDNVVNTCNGYKNTTEGYMETTEGYMDASEGYMGTTKDYMDVTEGYMETTEGYKNTTEDYMGTTADYMDATEGYKNTTNEYMGITEDYMETTEGYKNTTESYMKTTEGYMGTTEDYMKTASTKAKESSDSASAASTSETNANDNYMLSRSYAVGDTATRTNEAIDNAKYYYEQSKMIASGLNGALLPMGTITFEQLSTMTKEAGYMYNIKNEFVSTSEFKDGGDYTYPSGTNVYFTADGYWDCLAGTTSIIAAVDDVKDYLGISDETEIV